MRLSPPVRDDFVTPRYLANDLTQLILLIKARNAFTFWYPVGEHTRRTTQCILKVILMTVIVLEA